MKRSRFTEEQIAAILKQGEAGMKTVELCRQNGISEATYYNWKAKYGGLAVSDVQRLKRLVVGYFEKVAHCQTAGRRERKAEAYRCRLDTRQRRA